VIDQVEVDVTQYQVIKVAVGLCTLGVIVAAILHLLYFCLFDLHLAGRHVRMAFGLGVGVGVPIAAFGAYVKQPIFGLIVGASVCYLLAFGYIVFWLQISIWGIS
jgi:hypothetical protein